jgi:hypothetical protein
MHQNATVAEWYRKNGKHPVFANPLKSVPLPSRVQPLSLQVPRDGQLVEWVPKPKERAADLTLAR